MMGYASGVDAVLGVGAAVSASVPAADLVTAVATAVTAVVSVALGSFAFLQLRDARRVRHDETRPYVQIDFEVKRHMVYLHLQNLGRTAARNLSFKSSPPLESSMDRGDRHGPSRFLDRQWPSFAPGKEVTSIFDSAIAMLADDSTRPSRYEVTASYDDSTGKHFDDISVLDIESYRGRHFTTEKTVDDVARPWNRSGMVLRRSNIAVRGSSSTPGTLVRSSTRRNRSTRHGGRCVNRSKGSYR